MQQILDQLENKGWAVSKNFMEKEIYDQLKKEIRVLWKENDFDKAGIGRGINYQPHSEIRKDYIHWLNPSELTSPQKHYWEKMEKLQHEINNYFYLNLHELEAHYAAFPIGSFYKKHLDQFKSVGARLISTILYLNEDWKEADGGALRIYSNGSEDFLDIYPEENSFVCFRSDLIYHEVLPTNRQRYSLTGWFRRRVNPLEF